MATQSGSSPVRSCEFERNSRDAFYKLHWPLTVGPHRGHRGHCQVPVGIEQTQSSDATEVCIGDPPLRGVLKNALSAPFVTWGNFDEQLCVRISRESQGNRIDQIRLGQFLMPTIFPQRWNVEDFHFFPPPMKIIDNCLISFLLFSCFQKLRNLISLKVNLSF